MSQPKEVWQEASKKCLEKHEKKIILNYHNVVIPKAL